MQQIQNGVWPTMITPFADTGEIDYPAVQRLLQFYHRRGAAGVFAVCQSSEMFRLELEERAALVRFIVEHAPDGIQVVVSGHVADTLEEQVREAEAIMCEGVSAYVVLPNRFAAEDEDDETLIANMEAFLAAFPSVPLGLYECPYPYKRVLTPQVLQACVASGRFLFIKDTCSELSQIKEKLRLLEGTGIKLYNANGATLLESLRLGAAGYSGVMANFHPELYAWLCRHYRDEPEEADRLQQFLGVCSLAEYQYYPVNAKYGLSLQGVPMRMDSRVLDPDRFAESKRLEIRQLVELAAYMRETLHIAAL
ncbi:dihydrodipicolinate synthase family protein [Paenibacillus sp. IB182496]|uniref:Dihydrodipicolinate synthase family protein n=1 Tax=Paenibacillus sabuli TaxID=2772509 RepID=A0A927BTN4_9BACL|nr:dihydrodipicolinate synthase family protein [Paenibacillus sabuli]MBD2846597.1 dihydrodipicolinate synthase family protein [Paenibacillus sabuli]